jgi:hypothetical protein
MNPGVCFSVQFDRELSFLELMKIHSWFFWEWFSPGNEFFLKDGCTGSNGFAVKITRVFTILRGRKICEPIFSIQEEKIQKWITRTKNELSRICNAEVYIGFGPTFEAAQDDLNRNLGL